MVRILRCGLSLCVCVFVFVRVQLGSRESHIQTRHERLVTLLVKREGSQIFSSIIKNHQIKLKRYLRSMMRLLSALQSHIKLFDRNTDVLKCMDAHI